MVITDYNAMSVLELAIINEAFGTCYVIEGGEITGVEAQNGGNVE